MLLPIPLNAATDATLTTRPAPGPAQVRRRGPRAIERALDIHGKNAVPDVVGQIVELLERHEVGCAGVVDEDVQPAERLDRLPNHLAHRRVVAHVGLTQQRANTQRRGVVLRLPRLRLPSASS